MVSVRTAIHGITEVSLIQEYFLILSFILNKICPIIIAILLIQYNFRSFFSHYHFSQIHSITYGKAGRADRKQL